MTCFNLLFKVWPQQLRPSLLSPLQGCIALTTVYLGSVLALLPHLWLAAPPWVLLPFIYLFFPDPCEQHPCPSAGPLLALCEEMLDGLHSSTIWERSRKGGLQRPRKEASGPDRLPTGGSAKPGSRGRWAGKSSGNKGRHGESWDMLGWRGTVMWDPKLERGPRTRHKANDRC